LAIVDCGFIVDCGLLRRSDHAVKTSDRSPISNKSSMNNPQSTAQSAICNLQSAIDRMLNFPTEPWNNPSILLLRM
jgi:hypothetical protein